MTTHCDYQNDGRIITQPGKFQGEPVFAPHFWNLGLEGFADDDDGERYSFNVTKDDAEFWPELEGVAVVELREDSNGFVHAFTR